MIEAPVGSKENEKNQSIRCDRKAVVVGQRMILLPPPCSEHPPCVS
jgi:hypothetical protein